MGASDLFNPLAGDHASYAAGRVSASARSTTLAISGKWISQHGSILKITEKNGNLSGSYATQIGTPDTQKEFSLTGYSNGNLVGFVVSWEGSNSLTTWAGRYDPQRDCIYTMWHVVSAYGYRKNKSTGVIEEAPLELWEAFLTQASIFYREKSVHGDKSELIQKKQKNGNGEAD